MSLLRQACNEGVRKGRGNKFVYPPCCWSWGYHQRAKFGLTVGRTRERRRASDKSLWLRVDPGVVEAFTGRGPFFRHHLQHGQEEVGEVASIFVRPAVLLYQNVKQGPGLQLGDVPQLTCRGQKEEESEIPPVSPGKTPG